MEDQQQDIESLPEFLTPRGNTLTMELGGPFGFYTLKYKEDFEHLNECSELNNCEVKCICGKMVKRDEIMNVTVSPYICC